MVKKPIKPLIRALAEHIADDVMAAHDAGLTKRKRLPRTFHEKELAKETPAKARPKRKRQVMEE